MMKINKNVIIDLMPLYLANEASDDTRVLVEEYLKTDPELAKMVEQSETFNLSENSPIPLTQEDEMEAYQKAKQAILLRTFIMAMIISIILMAFLAMGLVAYFMLHSNVVPPI
ncbi:MAG: hypothetical protein JXA42_14315 [Anaerolineales bacterium]|nr:hypothetical protein [Anaerolineales bacterium]